MRVLATYIMRGRRQAILVAAVSAILSLILPPFGYLSAAVVALVTLRRGAYEGLLIGLGAALPVAAFAIFTPYGAAVVLPSMAVVWVLVGLLAWVLRRTVSLSTTFGVALMLAVGGVLVVFGAVGDPIAAWKELLQQWVTAVENGQPAGQVDVDQVLGQIASYATGYLAAMVALGLLLSLLLARWWQAMLYNPGGFRQEYHALRLGRGAALASVVVFAVAILTEGELALLAANITIVLVTVLMLYGLSLVHGIVALKEARGAWLIALYVAGLILLPQMALSLATAAIFDSWIDFRARLAKHGNDGPDASA